MTKRQCPGYEEVTFVPPKTISQPIAPSTKGPLSHGKSRVLPKSSTNCLMLNLSTFRWSTDEEFFALVTQYFIPEHYGPGQGVQSICGPWLEVLPLLLDRSRSTPLLSVSLRTLGYSIICKGNKVSTCCQWDLCRAESYSKAVHVLKHRLTEAEGV